MTYIEFNDHLISLLVAVQALRISLESAPATDGSTATADSGDDAALSDPFESPAAKAGLTYLQGLGFPSSLCRRSLEAYSFNGMLLIFRFVYSVFIFKISLRVPHYLPHYLPHCLLSFSLC